jgi:hypothetical protein
MAERVMPDRAKSLFPKQSARVFEASLESMRHEIERVKASVNDPRNMQLAFNELVRSRESILRFGEVRTVLTATPQNLAEELFARYVRMDSPVPQDARSAAI